MKASAITAITAILLCVGVYFFQQREEEKKAPLYVANFAVCMVHLRQSEHEYWLRLNPKWWDSSQEHHSLPDDYVKGHMGWTGTHIHNAQIYELNTVGVLAPKAGMTDQDLNTCLQMK